MFEILYSSSSQTAVSSPYCWNLENSSYEMENKNVGEGRETCQRSLEFICSTITN